MLSKTVESIKNFLEEVKVETKKCTFPTKEDTIGTTMVVVVFVVLATIYLWIVDVSFSSIIARILP